MAARRQLRKRKARPDEVAAELAAITQAHARLLAGLAASLSPRLAASLCDTLTCEADTKAGLDAAGQEGVTDFRRWMTEMDKAWVAAAEAWVHTSEQLTVCAAVLERGDTGAADVAASLLALAEDDSAPLGLPRMCVGVATVAQSVVEAWLYICQAASVSHVGGPGLAGFVTGDSHLNELLMRVVDEHGEALASVGPGDVAVSVCGGRVVSVEGSGVGSIAVCYTVERGVTDVSVRVTLLGHEAPGSPFAVGVSLFPESQLLPLTPAGLRVSFPRAVAREWLPDRSFRLLYRGSRDGLTPAGFHAKCDGVGPTLTLVRSDTGHTFGGYAHESWSSAGGSKVDKGEGFLFSIDGLWNDGESVFFPSRTRRKGGSMSGIMCEPTLGPAWANGLWITVPMIPWHAPCFPAHDHVRELLQWHTVSGQRV